MCTITSSYVIIELWKPKYVIHVKRASLSKIFISIQVENIIINAGLVAVNMPISIILKTRLDMMKGRKQKRTEQDTENIQDSIDRKIIKRLLKNESIQPITFLNIKLGTLYIMLYIGVV